MTSAFELDDIAYWLDGTWGTIEDVRRGEFGHMSDDYEVIRIDDLDRLVELGIASELGLI